MAYVIITDRLVLRPFTLQHISQTYISWLNDPELMQFSQHNATIHTSASCLAYVRRFDHVTQCLWAIETRQGIHIGNINAYLTPPHQLADVGLLIGSGQGGQGYGQEAWAGVMQALFENYAIRKVTGGCLSLNLAMIRIMKKCNMQPDGRRLAHHLLGKEPVDVVHFATQSAQYVVSPKATIHPIQPTPWPST